METTRNRRIAGALGAAALSAAALGALTACDGSGGVQHAHRAFDYGGTRLTVRASDANVVLTPYDGKAVSVDRWIHGVGTGGPKPSWSLDGDTLKVRVRCAGINVNCGGRYEIKVPRSVAVDLDSSGGNVRAAGFAHATRVSASDGNVTILNVKGALTASVSGGNLRVEDVAGAARLSTHDGNLNAASLHGRVTASSDGGNAVLRFAAAPVRVTASSHDGNLTVRVPQDGRSYRVAGATHDGNRSIGVSTDGGSRYRLDLGSDGGNTRVEGGR